MGRKESNQTNKQTKIRPDVLSDGSDTLTGKVAITNQLIYIKKYLHAYDLLNSFFSHLIVLNANIKLLIFLQVNRCFWAI